MSSPAIAGASPYNAKPSDWMKQAAVTWAETPKPLAHQPKPMTIAEAFFHLGGHNGMDPDEAKAKMAEAKKFVADQKQKPNLGSMLDDYEKKQYWPAAQYKTLPIGDPVEDDWFDLDGPE